MLLYAHKQKKHQTQKTLWFLQNISTCKMLFLKNVISEKEVPKGFHRGTTQSDSKRGQIVENHIPDFQHDVLYNMWSFRLFFTTINYESFRQQQMQAQVAMANLRSFKLNFCGCSMFNSKSKWWQQMRRAPIHPVFLLGCEIYYFFICLHQSLVCVWSWSQE